MPTVQDEIDALGSTRSDDLVHSGVLTSLLNEMDGIEELSGVIVVAATNRPEALVSRSGRRLRLTSRTLLCFDLVVWIEYCMLVHPIAKPARISSAFVWAKWQWSRASIVISLPIL